MTREIIQQTYNVQELKEKKKELKQLLHQEKLPEDEKWEVEFMIQLINKRIQLMTDLLIGIPLEIR